MSRWDYNTISNLQTTSERPYGYKVSRETDSFHHTVHPKKNAHGFYFAVLCCGYTLTDFPISIRLTSLVLWQSNDCPSASKATLMNMDKYFMWIHYERLHNHNKAKHNKTVCIFLGIYCMSHKICTRLGFASWWRHQMETFSALLALCAGNSPVPGEFPTQRPVTRSFDVFFDLRLNKPVCKTIVRLVIWDASAFIMTSL